MLVNISIAINVGRKVTIMGNHISDYVIDNDNHVDLLLFFQQNSDYASDYPDIYEWAETAKAKLIIDPDWNRSWVDFSEGDPEEEEELFEDLAADELPSLVSEFGYTLS